VAASAGGFDALIAILLRGKIDDLVIHMSLIAKIISVIFTIFCILFIRLFVNRIKQRDLYIKVNLEQLDKSYVKVKPQSYKHVFLITLTYMIFLSIITLFSVIYILLDIIFLFLL